jgi:hypothetical protein
MKKVGREWIAIIISLAAVAFSGLQWLESYRARQAALDATVGLDIDTDPAGKSAGISVRNLGPGIARILSVTYYLDKHQIDDIDEVLDSAGFDSSRGFRIVFDPGETMAAGETDALIDYRSKNKGDLDRAMDFVEKHLAVSVDYCSQSGKCERVCSDLSMCQKYGTVTDSAVSKKETKPEPQGADRLTDWLTAFGTVGAVITALLVSFFQTRTARRESASRTYFEEAVSALRIAVEDFARKSLPDGRPLNDRRHWLNFARALRTARSLATNIQTSELRDIWNSTEHYWRERVYDLLNPLWESLPADYYGYVAEEDKHKNFATAPGERAALSEASLVVVYHWIRWPDDRPDSVDRKLEFGDDEIEQMELFGPRGLARYLKVLREVRKGGVPTPGDAHPQVS